MLTRRIGFALILSVINLLAAGDASALTVERTVTPESVRQNPKLFSVKAEKRSDGLIHFTITHALMRPSYLVATTEIRDGDKVLATNTVCAYAREHSTSYYLAVAPDRIAGATFNLFEGTFVESGDDPVAIPGGTEFRFQLSEFARDAVEAK